jgi:hypothetical protein
MRLGIFRLQADDAIEHVTGSGRMAQLIERYAEMEVRLGIFGKKSRGLRQRFFGLIAGAAARMKILSLGFILAAGKRRKALPASERETRSVLFPNRQRDLII